MLPEIESVEEVKVKGSRAPKRLLLSSDPALQHFVRQVQHKILFSMSSFRLDFKNHWHLVMKCLKLEQTKDIFPLNNTILGMKKEKRKIQDTPCE